MEGYERRPGREEGFVMVHEISHLDENSSVQGALK